MAFALSQRAQAAGYRLQSYDEVGSTNAEALACARAGERGPLWLAAHRQTAGRGRRGRPWQTLDGNLAASVLRIVTVPPAVAATLSLVAGLAAYDALRACAPGLDARLKWPNDVLVGQAKLAGILLESEPVAEGAAVVIGIGVNVGMAPAGLPYPATSLTALGRHVRPEELFTALADTWLDYERLWDEGRGMARIRILWLDRAAGPGHEISVQIGERSVRGIFDTLDEEGRLVLKDENGRHIVVSAGEVTIGPRAIRETGAA
jgi:BirA family biotin operon repressor/biotin-[acetyl-CoA-carboxylase] ligase